MAHSRRPIISGNWKMNHNHLEAIKTIQKLAYALDRRDYREADVSVHPPFTDIRSVQTVLQADNVPIALGAQNCYHEAAGAFTGEVSAAMLAKLDVTYVIVGHSERRALFGESDDEVNRKAKAVISADLIPIVCVGETLAQRQALQAESTVAKQVVASLKDLDKAVVAGLVIAYEPIWAIGTGETATPDDAQQMCAHIRGLVADKWGTESAAMIRIQYGGSVKPGNAPDLMSQADIDGALVGGASLNPDVFARIVKYRLYR